MDPHSRRSQFNHRVPKSGPKAINSKFIDFTTHQKSPIDPKRPMRPQKSDSISTLLVRRPIATNSRVKQDEKYKKDMYLSFVNNALKQKTIVSRVSRSTCLHLTHVTPREKASLSMNW